PQLWMHRRVGVAPRPRCASAASASPLGVALAGRAVALVILLEDRAVEQRAWVFQLRAQRAPRERADHHVAVAVRQGRGVLVSEGGGGGRSGLLRAGSR